MNIHIIRASILHIPVVTSEPDKDFEYLPDGAMVVRDGKVIALGDANVILSEYQELGQLHDFSGQLLVPGFIDSHLHFPQTEMIASYGEQLLEWLKNYTFPTENKFADEQYATKIADVFLRQLLKNGTTTGMVYGSVHKAAANALFSAASQQNMLMIAGKVCMDRNCPETLQDTPESALQDSAELIEKWHGKHRQYYALTPRFAPTSSPQQMQALGDLAKQYPDVFIQTHLSENKNEIAWVKSLYPDFENYLDVYDHYGLVRPRAVFGHCLHLSEQEWQRLAQSKATIAFCPTSNLFLGSGLFDIATAKQHTVNVALATDVGAGTSFNMLRTMGEAYKVCQLQQAQLSPLEGFYMMTQGAAAALQLEDKIGNLNVGSDADFVILDPAFDELSELRYQQGAQTPQDILFALSMLGDDRMIASTWVAGDMLYQKGNN